MQCMSAFYRPIASLTTGSRYCDDVPSKNPNLAWISNVRRKESLDSATMRNKSTSDFLGAFSRMLSRSFQFQFKEYLRLFLLRDSDVSDGNVNLWLWRYFVAHMLVPNLSNVRP